MAVVTTLATHIPTLEALQTLVYSLSGIGLMQKWKRAMYQKISKMRNPFHVIHAMRRGYWRHTVKKALFGAHFTTIWRRRRPKYREMHGKCTNNGPIEVSLWSAATHERNKQSRTGGDYYSSFDSILPVSPPLYEVLFCPHALWFHSSLLIVAFLYFRRRRFVMWCILGHFVGILRLTHHWSPLL